MPRSTLEPEQTNLFRSGSEMFLASQKAEKAAQNLKTFYKSEIFNITFSPDSQIYKFKLNEIEYCFDDAAQIFFIGQDERQATIVDPQFYKDLDRAFLTQAIKANQIEIVKKLLENGSKPFYETEKNETHTRNQDILDLINRYKIMWIIEQIITDEVKEISLDKFAQIYCHQDHETCLNALKKLQVVWLESMDEEGKVNSAEITDILMSEGLEKFSLSEILKEKPALTSKEKRGLFQVISNNNFSSYDEDRLNEEKILIDFTRDMVRIISSLRNIFDEKNRENFLEAEKLYQQEEGAVGDFHCDEESRRLLQPKKNGLELTHASGLDSSHRKGTCVLS